MDNFDAKAKEILIFALGGLGEVGKNMYCVQYQNELIIIDSGLLFPDEYLMRNNFVQHTLYEVIRKYWISFQIIN